MVNSFLLIIVEVVLPSQVYLSVDWYSKCIYMPVFFFFLLPSFLKSVRFLCAQCFFSFRPRRNVIAFSVVNFWGELP